VAEYLAKYAEGIRRLEMTPEQIRAEYSVIILITPRRVHGWI
jgi:hypothetical protein